VGDDRQRNAACLYSVLIVLLGVMLCCFLSVFRSKQMVSLCQMSVMTCRFVGTSLMVLGRLPMMSGGVFVVFSGFFVMLRTCMLSHFASLLQN
jgi:hypothetical protein